MALERYEGNDNYKASGVCWPLLSSLRASKKKKKERERERKWQTQANQLSFKVCFESKRVSVSVFKCLLSHTPMWQIVMKTSPGFNCKVNRMTRRQQKAQTKQPYVKFRHLSDKQWYLQDWHEYIWSISQKILSHGFFWTLNYAFFTWRTWKDLSWGSCHISCTCLPQDLVLPSLTHSRPVIKDRSV